MDDERRIRSEPRRPGDPARGDLLSGEAAGGRAFGDCERSGRRLMAWSLTLGNFSLSLAEVYGALKGEGASQASFIVLDLRLPRVLTAVAVGAMLAMSGAIFQGSCATRSSRPTSSGSTPGQASRPSVDRHAAASRRSCRSSPFLERSLRPSAI